MPSKSASEDNTLGSSTGRETARIQRVALYAFVLNLGLAAVKALMAIQSGSLAITAGNTGWISAHFGESPYFALLRFRLMDHHLIKQEIVENPHQQVEKAKGIRVAEWLVNQQVDELLVKEEMRHKGPGYVFSNAGITIHTADVDTLDQAIDALKKRLSP